MDGRKTNTQKTATTKHDGLSINKFYCHGKSEALTSLKKTEANAKPWTGILQITWHP